MKINTFIVAMVVFWTVPSLGQQWDIGGNNITSVEWFGADGFSTVPIRFEHQTTINAGHFQWRTGVNGASERMRLTNGGWLGLNTSAPAMMFHVSEGGILSTGTTGNQPALNPGSRFIWVPGRRS